MAYNNEAKRMFEQFKHQLPQAIKFYRLSTVEDKTGYMISNMLRDMHRWCRQRAIETRFELQRALFC